MRLSVAGALILSLLLAASPSLAQPIPPEVKSFSLKFFKEMGELNATLADEIGQASQASQVALAVETYTVKVEPLVEGMAALEKKYQNFFKEMQNREDEEGTGDAELDRALDEFEKISERLERAMLGSLIPYLEDEQVQANLIRLQQMMDRLSLQDEDEDDDSDW